MDTRLRVTDPTFERERSQITETLMQPLAVVEAFNKRKDLPTRFVPTVVRLVMRELVDVSTHPVTSPVIAAPYTAIDAAHVTT